jgi:hypothetical protein
MTTDIATAIATARIIIGKRIGIREEISKKGSDGVSVIIVGLGAVTLSISPSITIESVSASISSSGVSAPYSPSGEETEPVITPPSNSNITTATTGLS